MAKQIYFRNFIFGVEDSLVSTVGLLSGVAIAGVASKTILLTGVILILVEAFSMAAGSFLTEHSVEAFVTQAEAGARVPFLGGLVMFISYLVSGFIPLGPYLIFEPNPALAWSIGLSIISLFILGFIGGRLSNTSIWRGGLRMAVVGGIAIALGIAAGTLIGH